MKKSRLISHGVKQKGKLEKKKGKKTNGSSRSVFFLNWYFFLFAILTLSGNLQRAHPELMKIYQKGRQGKIFTEFHWVKRADWRKVGRLRVKSMVQMW